ncbi:MAG TPA: mannonate dehydratase [Bryobacterales bacterium]|nr:mannonate dehydratase [Bryobacterales bacterium]
MIRRNFLRFPLAAGVARLLPAAGAQNSRRSVIDEYDPANIKLAHRVPATISDDDLLFLKQIGMRWARVEFGGPAPFARIRATQEHYARFGIQIFSGVCDAYRSVRIQLGRPGRDQDIETFQTFVRDLGRLGIPVSNIDFHPGNTYTTTEVKSPRGYTVREFDLTDFRAKVEKQRFEREYSADEIWANYTYFIKAVLPVAEEAKVKLALHPDDPPLTKMNGVAKIFTHYDGYHRAEQIAGNSPNWGLTFCIGTWSEGGNRMGKDVFEMIRDFGGRGKIIDVHFRNVSSPLPHFIEAFPDDGYQDMYRVMKTLREVRFSGSAVPDHVPQVVGDSGIRRAGTAYCIAYMRALLRRANEEVG